jgi:hypothetical protein
MNPPPSTCFLLACMAAAVAACSTTPSQTPVAKVAATQQDVVCEREMAVGSHISKRVCLTKAQREQRERDMQVVRDSMVEGSTHVCTQGSC